MGATFSRLKTWVAAEVLTAADLNAEYDNILDNFDPDGLDDASIDTTAMQAMADPYPSSTESLATDLRGEIQRLRYQMDQVIGAAQWYSDVPINLTTVVNSNEQVVRGRTAGAQVITTGTETTVTLSTEDFDPSGILAANIITPTVAGYYWVKGSFEIFTTLTAGKSLYITLTHSTPVGLSRTIIFGAQPDDFTISIMDLLYFDGSTDNVRLRVRHELGSDVTIAESILIVAGPIYHTS